MDSRNAYELARLADVSSPDSPDSPGARWLVQIAEAVDEANEWQAFEDDEDDRAHELSDSLVPVYTHERWQVFTDLGAFAEDVSELGHEHEDMTTSAGIALYLIASRLVRALITEAVEQNEDEDEQDGARCLQCDEPMSPVEAIMGAVCGKCCRANHKAVAGS